MKNLKLSYEISSKIELNTEDEVLRFAAVDIERNRLFFASSADNIYTISLSSMQQVLSFELIQCKCGQNDNCSSKSSPITRVDPVDLEPGDFITTLDYLMEKEALIIGTSYGLILLYTVDDDTTEMVGRVEGGVKCISPSPDGDLLAIVTGLRQILVMTHDWDVLYERELDDQTEGIDVGISADSTFSSNYIHDSPISWRGDGKYFATISNIQNSSPILKSLKVWERDSGALHSISEPKAFMGTVLDWIPSGAKLAAVLDRKEQMQSPAIVFIERNGLERSSFAINEEANAVIEILKWNCNSDLLASLVRRDSHDLLKIWFLSNNHWYLKQEIRYPRENGVKFMWDPVKPLQLISWTLDGQLTTFNFIWVTAVMDNSTALIIDDSKVLITPLSLSLIPPPMCLFNLKLPCAVQSIAFCSRSCKNYLAASLSDGSLSVSELPPFDTWEELEDKEFCVETCTSDMQLGPLVHLAWLDSHVLVGISEFCPSMEGKLGYCLLEMELTCSEDHDPGSINGSGWNVRVFNKIYLEGIVIGLVANTMSGSSAYIQFDGGKVSEYISMVGGSKVVPFLNHENMCFSTSCPWMDLALVKSSGPQNALLFGLDENSKLHANGNILCNNCSSYALYSNSGDRLTTHLVLVTKQDLLYVVDIHDVLHGDVGPQYYNFLPVIRRRGEEDQKIYINVWERGAKIVGVLHGDDSAVILQAPRGNLECVYPRKLVLTSIVNALVHKRFKDALLMVRRHRIDFNIIVDYCGWNAFLQSAEEFIKQVNNLSYVTEFVCSVKSENIFHSLYKSYTSLLSPSLKESKDVAIGELSDTNDLRKVTSVLLAVRKALEEGVVESPGRELCILTTLARSYPPALEEALQRIKLIRELELSSSDDAKRIQFPSAEESLKHLLWLCDSEAVFEAALGLYDLNLSAMVALNSQKDPKEFLPFLQDLQRMPILIMKFTIDLKLHRYEKALHHIVSAGDAYFDDCMNLIKKYPQLFPVALQLINDSVKRRQVLEAWGDHLSFTKSFEDAATTYLCCGCLDKALKAYRESGNWGGVLTIAGLIKLGKEEVVQLAHELCEELHALGKSGDAAKIALEYCGDVNAGINLLVSAREWDEALRIAFLHKRDDLISEVTTSSLECANVLISETNEGLEKVGKYSARYLAVRQRRLLLAAKLQSEEHSVNDLDDETASETSSNFSGMSAYSRGSRKGTASISSTASTKARDMRRQRKKGKIRAGSPDEEIALVEHLKGMSVTAGAKRELKSLLTCLVMLGKEDIARKLQQVSESFQLSQMAAIKLAEDSIASNAVDERVYNLEHYIAKMRELQCSDFYSWKLKVLV
ncbi:general transcription factor [Lithospermum erythrorhizon]|uniref:Elongator complex protein 1 n=1 Tax=Lithospermum erythrorhizon TaxID=34254 RepID=A0AAV3RAA3_LITER